MRVKNERVKMRPNTSPSREFGRSLIFRYNWLIKFSLILSKILYSK